MAASGFEPDRRPPELSVDLGRRISSSGQEAAQVGPGQQVAEGVASKGRTEAGLPDTDPGFGRSTAGAQQEHDGEDGGIAIQQIMEAWPWLLEAIRMAILAVVQANRR